MKNPKCPECSSKIVAWLPVHKWSGQDIKWLGRRCRCIDCGKEWIEKYDNSK